MTFGQSMQDSIDCSSHSASERLPELRLLRIPVSDDYVVGRLYAPAGNGPHPTLLLLHGFPGTQSNHDLAAALQQAGYQTLVFHYRGLWGSTGQGSVKNALEDVETVLSYLRSPGASEQYGVDTNRIAIVGHSFGGFLAIMTAARDSSIPACVSIAGANLGLLGQAISQNEELREQVEASYEYSASFVTGYTNQDLSRELIANHGEWNLLGCASKLADRPLMLIASANDDTTPASINHDPLIQAFVRMDGHRMEQLVMDHTDHGFEGKRAELCRVVLEWLRREFPAEAAEVRHGEEK